MPEPSAKVARLRAFLDEVDVPSGDLRRDPEGKTWLSAEMQALVADDPACHAELRRFVDREIELFGSVRQKPDALFTAAVLKKTSPDQIVGAGLDPRLRGVILASAYALATAVAYFMLAPLLGLAAVGTWTDRLAAAAAVADGGEASPGLGLLVAAVGFAVVVAFGPRRGHTPPA
jgi:anti-sigma factor RsiW